MSVYFPIICISIYQYACWPYVAHHWCVLYIDNQPMLGSTKIALLYWSVSHAQDKLTACLIWWHRLINFAAVYSVYAMQYSNDMYLQYVWSRFVRIDSNDPPSQHSMEIISQSSYIRQNTVDVHLCEAVWFFFQTKRWVMCIAIILWWAIYSRC